MVHTHKKRHPRFEPRTQKLQGQRPTCYSTLFLVCMSKKWYVAMRTNRQFDNLTKKQKEHPPQGVDTSTAEADPGRVGRDE